MIRLSARQAYDTIAFQFGRSRCSVSQAASWRFIHRRHRHDVDSLPTPHNAMNFDEEVRLYTTSAERERTENLSTLYSIIVSLEYLERAYVRDSVTGKE